ncbi:MAG: ABC transporter permease [Eubacterium sp.]|nr:ABC transporter permease [Eubacterium sp.]
MEKREKITIGIIIISVIAFASVLFMEKQRLDKSYSQLAYVRWAGNGDGSGYSQVSVFYDEKDSPGLDEIKKMRNEINQKLREDALLDSDGQGKVWTDAYSAVKDISIRKDTDSIQVKAYLVGGDFFQIHPIKLKSGNYPDTEDLQILLDENAAWNLFGSSDIEGLKVWIDDAVFTVSGVVAYEDTGLNYMAIGNRDTVYIPYETYAALKKIDEKNQPGGAAMEEEGAELEGTFTGNDGASEDDSEKLRITCYEAVLPNPIKNYGFNMLNETNGIALLSDEEKEKQRSTLNFEGKEIVDNSSRYKIMSLIERMRERKYSDMRTNAVAYPYWENLARYEETRCIHIMISGCIIMFLIVVMIVRMVRNRKRSDKAAMLIVQE